MPDARPDRDRRVDGEEATQEILERFNGSGEAYLTHTGGGDG